MMRPQELLAAYPPEIGELAFTLRDLVRQTLPLAREKVIPGWKILAYSRRNMFLYLAPASARVALGFSMGSQLTDPAGLLVRLGRSVNSRNVLLAPGSPIPAEPLRALLLQAYELAH